MRLASAVAVVLAGCWSTTSPSATSPTPEHPRGADYSATIADPLGFLPRDAELVVALDVAHLRAGALYQTWEPRLAGALELDGSPIARCNARLVERVGSITLGLRSTPDGNFAGVAVLRGADVRGWKACLAKVPGTAVEGETIVTTVGALHVPLRAIDATTLVGVYGTGATPQTLDAVLASGAPIATAPGYGKAFDDVDLHQALWFALGRDASSLRSFQALGYPPEVVFGSVDATDFAAATVHVRFADAATANGFGTWAKGQLAGAKNYVERLDVTVAARDVVFELAINGAQLTQLLGIVGLTPP